MIVMTLEHRKTQMWYDELILLRSVARLSFCCRCTTLASACYVGTLCFGRSAFYKVTGCLTSSNAAVQDMDGDFVEDTDEGSGWSSDHVSRFFDAFQEHGQDWVQVKLQITHATREPRPQRTWPAGVTTSGQDCPAK